MPNILESEIRGFERVRDVLKKIEGSFTAATSKAILERVAMSARVMIEQRTLSGNDVRGIPFKEYTEAYSRYKAYGGAKGKKAKNKKDGPLYTGPVNLNDTGKMLGAIQDEMKTQTSILIYVGGDPAVRGLAHQTGAGNVPTREWFGINRDEKATLVEQFTEEANAIWSKISGENK